MKTAKTTNAAARRLLYLVCGDDEYHVAKNSARLAKECSEILGGAETEKLDGAAENAERALAVIGRCMEALESRGLFGGSKVVWLANADFLGRTQTAEASNVAAAVKSLAGAIAAAGDDVGVIVSTLAVHRASPLLKVFEEKGKVLEFSLPPPWERERHAELVAAELFTDAGIKASPEEISEFVEVAGTDYRQLEQETRKLALFLHPKNDMAAGAWRNVVCTSREAVVWDFADAMGGRELKRALLLLNSLLFQKEDPVAIVSVAASHFRLLAIVRELGDAGCISLNYRGTARLLDIPEPAKKKLDAVFGETGRRNPSRMTPFTLGKIAAQAARFSMEEIVEAMALAGKTRWQIVNSSVPAPLILEEMLIKICRR